MRRLAVLLACFVALALPNAARADSPTHVVAYGETLYSIARAYGVAPAALAEANGITVESWVYAGQRMVIPSASDTSNSAPAAPVSVAQAMPGGVYTVRAGDTLSGVARNFGVSIGAIADANNIPPNGFLYTGWQLKIPGAASASPNANANPAPVNVEQPSKSAATAITNYVVKPGDTLYGIAIEHDVTMAALRTANDLSTLYVYSGQRLVIPNGTNSPLPAASAPAAKAAAPSNVIARVENIPVYKQEQTLTCEQSAASMATRGELSEKQIVAAMPRSENPFEGIRGETDYELLGGLTHYGTYAQGLQKGLKKLGRESTTYYGQSYEQFKEMTLSTLKAGRPVIWWTTWHESFQKPQWVEVTNGIKVPLIPYEHAVVIVEATNEGVRYHDPYDGSVRFASWANHERTSGYFNNMALVVY